MTGMEIRENPPRNPLCRVLKNAGATGKGQHGCSDALRLRDGSMEGVILTRAAQLGKYGREHLTDTEISRALAVTSTKAWKPRGKES